MEWEHAYFGVNLGAQTTANDSGSIRWNPECVCRSTEDIKPIPFSAMMLGRRDADEAITHMIEKDVCGSVKQIPRSVRRFMHPCI